VVLVSRDLGLAAVRGNIWGQLAVLAAASSYALAATFSRRHLRGQSPLTQALMVILIADALLWPGALAFERPWHIPALPITWLALAWLGLLGSCLAYLLYFYLINAWGATRASLVAYVFPAIGLVLGIVFLGETADWRLMLGSLLIVAGIAVVNLKVRFRPAPAATVAK
jgi:drug/metabolite transporter (DMT)-like permease